IGQGNGGDPALAGRRGEVKCEHLGRLRAASVGRPGRIHPAQEGVSLHRNPAHQGTSCAKPGRMAGWLESDSIDLVARSPWSADPDGPSAPSGLTLALVSCSLRFVAAYQAGLVLEVLGDATRREIFEMLGQRPRPVGELAAELPVSRPAVSQHLKVLKDAGLVIARPNGTRRIYHIDRNG